MILTLDLGTTVTKAVLWERDGMVDRAEVVLESRSPEPGWAEQDARLWWTSVVEACARLRAGDPARLASVEVIGCTGARCRAACSLSCPAILIIPRSWSMRRADNRMPFRGVGRAAGLGRGPPIADLEASA